MNDLIPKPSNEQKKAYKYNVQSHERTRNSLCYKNHKTLIVIFNSFLFSKLIKIENKCKRLQKPCHDILIHFFLIYTELLSK